MKKEASKEVNKAMLTSKPVFITLVVLFLLVLVSAGVLFPPKRPLPDQELVRITSVSPGLLGQTIVLKSLNNQKKFELSTADYHLWVKTLEQGWQRPTKELIGQVGVFSWQQGYNAIIRITSPR